MSPNTWRYALALRLGLPLFTGTSSCPVCARRSASPAPDLDVAGKHALLCRYEDGLNRRHNGLRDFICYRILKPLGLVVYREHALPRLSVGPSDLSTPMRLDLYIPADASLSAQAQGLDITVAHPLATSHVKDASRIGGAAATHLEDAKHRLYGPVCVANSITLTPFGIDVFGALGRHATDFIKRLSIFSAERRGSSPHEEEHRLYERITIALHSLQGRMISTRQVM